MLRSSPVLLLGFMLLACDPGEPTPTPESVAKAFGLVDGRVLHYAVSNGQSATEDHSYKASSSYAERLVVRRSEKTQNFDRNEADGTVAMFDFEALGAQLQLLHQGDCLPRCKDFSPPVVVAAYPLATGARAETTSTVTVTTASGTTTHSERHVVTVGAKGTTVLPAGSFEAYSIAWQRWVDGVGPETTTIGWSLELGPVSFERADGAILKLASQDN